MAKARIPKKEVTLRSSEDTERLEMLERIETILGHAKYRLTLLGAFAFLLLGLLVTGAQNLHQLNSQGIAYILLAKHYVNGDWSLAISSYWSPALSWLIAMGLKIGWDTPTAARVATGFSALVFWIGSIGLLFVTKASIRSLLLGAWLIALTAIPWSITYISPDLLAAAVLLCALTSSIYSIRVRSKRAMVTAGILWGLVYYCHSLLLPAVGFTLVSLAVLAKLSARSESKPWIGVIGAQAAIALAVMIPWVIVLSSVYDRPTVGSAWRINHAVVGPNAEERYHPCFGRFNTPSEGRYANWEDPARLEYLGWSPFADPDHKRHQRDLITAGARSTFKIFLDFGAFGIAILSLVACGYMPVRDIKNHLPESWRWGVIPVLGIVFSVLPFAVSELDTRFFYAAYPIMATAGFRFIEWLPIHYRWQRFPLGFAIPLAAVLFVLPMIPRFAASLEGMANPGGYVTLELVDRMKSANVSGTVAGDGMLMGSRTGLFIAALLSEPWVGDSMDVVGTDYLASGADLIVVHRQHRVNSDMEFNPAFRDLDTVLFPDKMQAEEFPLRVYQVNR